jgi:penicillin G amidase
MKLFKKILVSLLLIIIIAVIGGYIFLNHISNKGIPEYNGEIQLKNLKEKVVVRRDAHAIPHIIAQNEEDLYRATGYVLAQDRLWQMDLLRRVTQGRLSEIFGKDLEKSDLLLRALRIPDKTKIILKNTDKNIIEALEAFADGVNQYIDTHKDELPPEFTILGYEPEPWKPEHSVNLIGYMAWDLTASWKPEIFLHELRSVVDSSKFYQAIPDMSNHKSYTFEQELLDSSELSLREELLSVNDKLADLGINIFEGSNNWAVSGKKSTTGLPLLANDMHVGLFAPGIWYQMHQYVEGKLNVTGLVLPGAPFIIDGHNENIAWGMTMMYVDDMDFYRETINPKDSNQYLLNGEWKSMEVRKETIFTSEGDTIYKTNRFTHRGPVISGFKGIKDEVISVRWTGNEYSSELRSVYLLNRAKNWDDFKDALRSFNSLNQNIVYADIKGNIGLFAAGNIPIRKGKPWNVFPGDTTEFDWQGFVPFDSLPYEYNPERGYVSSANCKTTPPSYPYYVSAWYDLPYRLNRIREMLEEKDKLSINDFKAMLRDHKSKMVEDMREQIVTNISTMKDLDKWQEKAVNVFKDWDGIYTTESVGASIFEYFYVCLVRNTVYDELGEDMYQKFILDKILVRNLVKNLWSKPESDWWDNVSTKEKKEDFEMIVHKSFKDALDSLNLKYGAKPENWQWGLMHTLTLKHPLGKVDILDMGFNLNRGPFPVGGSFHTVSPYSYSFKNLFKANHGASHRHIYSTANWDESLTVIPTGISGIPSSPYYCDQTEMYLKNEYHSDYFDILKVEKDSKFRLTLLPAK